MERDVCRQMRGTGIPFKLRPAERRLVEVGGVEPPSETASNKLLRVYPAFDLARGMPTGGLILKQPFGYTNFGARAESSEASPAEIMPRRRSRRLLPRHRGRN